MVLGFPRVEDPAGLAATDSVDVLLKGGVSDQACSFGYMLYRFALRTNAHISKSRYGAPDFVAGALDVGYPAIWSNWIMSSCFTLVMS